MIHMQPFSIWLYELLYFSSWLPVTNNATCWPGDIANMVDKTLSASRVDVFDSI